VPGPSSQPFPPRWARVIDFLCFLLVIVAMVIAISGGFRVRLAGVRFALTSPFRLLVWVIVLGVLRHLAAPQAPIYRDLPARLAAAWGTPAVRAAMSAAVGTRLPILFVGYLAVVTIGYREGGAPWKLFENEFLNLQNRWDTGWYLGIAVEGYEYRANAPMEQQNIVFFPALPIAMRVTGRLLGGASPAVYILAGTLIAVIAFFGALVYLYRFARDMLGEDDRASYAVWLIAAFPFALFYSAVYTESLYLLGTIGAFHHFRRREFWRAGAWGLLVGLTRPNGAFLSVPLAILAAGAWLPTALTGDSAAAQLSSAPPMRRAHELAQALATAAMPGIGVLLYSAFMWRLTGHPLEWASGHLAWGRAYSGLSALVTERYEYLSQGGLYAYTSELPLDLLNALGAIFVLIAVWPVARRLGFAYAVFILINILPPLAAGGLISAGRFSAVLFPAFVWLASVVPERHRPAWLASFMAVQAFNATLFYTWRPLY
jgi:hypothetical protein